MKHLLGKRIELDLMSNDPCPIQPGAKGTVYSVCETSDGHYHIGVDWEIPRHLGLIWPIDKFHEIAKEPISEEAEVEPARRWKPGDKSDWC